jgi:hypothetical protein
MLLAADHIRDLVIGFVTTERVTQPTEDANGVWKPTTRYHTIQHPPLLTQLEEAIAGDSARSDEDAARGSFKSKPSAHLEAVDVLARIRREAAELAHTLDVPVFRQTTTKKILLEISGKVGGDPHPLVRRWWVAARLTTRWDLRPFQPNGAPCPECWEVKSLRIDLGDELARCVECAQTWDGPSAVAALAQHVKWCTDHDVTKPRHWLHDDTGELIECVECLPFRDQYTEHKMGKALADACKVDRTA